MAIPTFFRLDEWVKTAVGPAVPGAQIYICSQPANITKPVGPLVQVYADPNGFIPVTQPLITDGFGHFNFYVLPGTYTIVIYINGALSVAYPDQSIGVSATQAVTLQVNGVNLSSQTLLNLVNGTNATVQDNGGGTVQINAPNPLTSVFTLSPGWFTTSDFSPITLIYNSFAALFSGYNGTTYANQVKVWAVRVPWTVTISAVWLSIQTQGGAGVKGGFGIYSSDGNTKIFSWDTIDMNGGAFQHVVVSPKVTLQPGTYYMASTSTLNNAGQPTSFGGAQASGSSEPNKAYNLAGVVRTGLAGNVSAGNGVMPATLGTLTTSNFDGIPLFVFEP